MSDTDVESALHTTEATIASDSEVRLLINEYISRDEDSPYSRDTRLRIQSELGARALPLIVDEVKQGNFDPYQAVILTQSILAHDEELYPAYKDLAFYEKTYGNTNGWSAISRAVKGMCATSPDEETFKRDMGELITKVEEVEEDFPWRKYIISEINSFQNNYSDKKTSCRSEIERERRGDNPDYITRDRISGVLEGNDDEDNYRSDEVGWNSLEIEYDDAQKEEPKVKKTLKRISKESVGKILKDSVKPTGEGEFVSSTEKERGDLGKVMKEASQTAELFYEFLADNDQSQFFPLNENELAFLDAVKAEYKELAGDIDDRIIKTQLASLHALVFSGGLDVLFRNYLAEQIRQDKDFPNKYIDVLEIKTNLAFAFLQRVDEKNKEMEMTDIESGAVTVGMEIEYGITLAALIDTKSVWEEFAKELNERWEGSQNPVEKAVYEKEKKKLERRLEIIDKLSKRGESKLQNDFARWEPGLEFKYKMNILQLQKFEHEMNTLPSASYKTQLRELITAATIGGLSGNWNVHETFGGVELSPNHTEFMDALPMTIAADFWEFAPVKEEVKNNVDYGYGVYSEIYAKTGANVDYFPFHKARVSGEVVDENDKLGTKAAVELRSLPDYTPKGFVKLVRQMSFNYFFAHGVKAFQKSEEDRTPQDNELIGAYIELMKKWKSLLDSKDIVIPTPKERHMQDRYYDEDWDEQKNHNPYVAFVGKMIILSQDDPEFTKKTREVIRGYNHKVKSILGVF